MRYSLKLLIYNLLIISSINSYSQTNDSLDFELQIKQVINDSSSNFYYPKLIEKINKQPSQINILDCFYLYYGQVFQKDFNFISFLRNPERLDFDKAAMKDNCKKAFNIGITILKRDPTDLTVLLPVCNCIKKYDYADTTYYFKQRFENLLTAIF